MYDKVIGQSYNCDRCSTPFHAKAKNQKYCSNACNTKSWQATLAHKNCQQCGKSFKPGDYRARFCSRSCNAVFHNTGKVKRPAHLPLNCLVCGVRLLGSQQSYCSRAHFNQHRRAGLVSQWLAGNASIATDITGDLAKWARAYLIELAGEKCSECGWCTPNPKIGKPILTVDHINGDWTDQRFENLKVLCYNCHTLTPTFGSLNKNSPGKRRVTKRTLDTAATTVL